MFGQTILFRLRFNLLRSHTPILLTGLFSAVNFCDKHTFLVGLLFSLYDTKWIILLRAQQITVITTTRATTKNKKKLFMGFFFLFNSCISSTVFPSFHPRLLAPTTPVETNSVFVFHVLCYLQSI